jgi:NADH:ubiquinone oxidoreductase subunit 3 (subunit A)
MFNFQLKGYRFIIFYCFIRIFLIIFILILAILLLSWFTVSFIVNKSSPFECGFDCFFSSGRSFSISFFCICLMFLLFDVELVLLGVFPFYFSLLKGFYFLVIILLIFFIVFTTFYEWYNGLLQWIFSFLY